MKLLAAPIITGDALWKLIVGALGAGLGITFSFSLLIYSVDRASTLRREDRRGAAAMFQVVSVLALLGVAALVVYGLILMAGKPK